MDNHTIARLLGTVADIYEVMGENRFRVRSYRNGADAVDALGVQLSVLLSKEGEAGIAALSGIGKGLAGKIAELVTSGRCAAIDELMAKTPPGLLQILSLGGMGPKKTGVLYTELNIDTIEALEAAAKRGELQAVAGFGLKTEQKILEAIRAKRSFDGRFRLSIGQKLSAELARYLKEVPGVCRVETAGGVRRWREDIGGIELLAISDDPATLLEAFIRYGGATDAVTEGGKLGSMRLENGMKATLRLFKESEFGAALLYHTGSKGHIAALNRQAALAGLKLTENALTDISGKRHVGGAAEENIYAAIGLQTVMPELREGRGEVEAALCAKLPVTVQIGDIAGDLHCHTRASDGAGTVEEMAKAAMERGYAYLAVTDHSGSLRVANGLDSSRLRRQIEEIESYNRGLKEQGIGFRVLKGTEVDILIDGSLDHANELLDSLDIVVAAVHSGFGMAKDKMTARVVRAIESGRVDVIAHPTGRLIGMRPPVAIDMEAVLKAAKAHGVAMEINSYPERLDLNDRHLRIAKEIGVKVVISTDAHATDQFANIDYGIHTAMRGWVEPQMVLNSLPLGELLDHLGAKR